MTYPFAVAVAVVAFVGTPIACQAATAHHHKMHHLGHYASIRAAYGMSAPHGVISGPLGFCDTINVGNFELCAPESLKNNGG